MKTTEKSRLVGIVVISLSMSIIIADVYIIGRTLAVRGTTHEHDGDNGAEPLTGRGREDAANGWMDAHGSKSMGVESLCLEATSMSTTRMLAT